MTKPPEFEELIGPEVPGHERDRLRRVHELLLEAGAPPELSDRLQQVPAPERARVIPLPPRRRWRTASVLAAATLLITFGAGWLVGDLKGGAHVERTVAMTGSHGARASLVIFQVDSAGNWPMRLEVTGLRPLGGGKTYALWLTKHGKLESPCGTFTVHPGETKVSLNAPYRLTEYDGWVVVRTGTTTPLLQTV